MKVKALFLSFFILVAGVNISNAAQKEYSLIFEKENLWVASTKIQPLIEVVKQLKTDSEFSLKAVCSSQSKLCKQRIEIINYILTKQNISEKIKLVGTSSELDKNVIILKLLGFNENKYSNLLINYDENDFKPVTKSEQLINSELQKAEFKYLSQFNLYCKQIDSLCEKRFDYINNKLAATLTFKYNIFLKISPSLNNNQVQLESFGHDYNRDITNKTKDKSSIKLVTPVKTIKKPKIIKNDYIISFAEDCSDLADSEKKKINKILETNKNAKFFFACNRNAPELCKKRIQEIKFHALTETQSLIELYQLEESAHPNLIVIRVK